MQDLKLIRENTFKKGMNDKTKPEDLDPGFCADAVNVLIEDNKIIKRSGYSIIGNAPATGKILGEEDFLLAAGTNYILRARNTSDDANAVIEAWTGSGNWSTLTGGVSQTASLNTEFVMANNAMYIFNGTDTVLKTANGTSVSTVSAIPKGKGGKWFHNFLFVFGITSYPNRLYFSDVNTPETFDGTNGYVDVNPDDGDVITALAVLKDELLIFKRNRIWSLTGFGTTDFTVADLGERVTGFGTMALRSVIETGNDVYYLSYQGSVPHFRSIQRTKLGVLYDAGIISDDITGTMNGLSKSQLSKCCGVFDGRRCRWSVCTTGITNNKTLIYDTIETSWVRWTNVSASVFHRSNISGSIRIYFGSDINCKSYEFDGSNSDNGTAITMTYDTRLYNPNTPAQSKFKYMYLTADIKSNVTLNVYISKDGFTFSFLGSFNLTGKGSSFGNAIFGTNKFGSTTVARARLDSAGGTSYYMQYRFQNTISATNLEAEGEKSKFGTAIFDTSTFSTGNLASDQIAIREYEILYKPRRLRSIS